MNESKTRCTATSPKPRQWVLTTDSVWGLNFVVGHLGKQRNEHEQRTEKRKKKKKGNAFQKPKKKRPFAFRNHPYYSLFSSFWFCSRSSNFSPSFSHFPTFLSPFFHLETKMFFNRVGSCLFSTGAPAAARLGEKVAVITGGASGIGKATCDVFAATRSKRFFFFFVSSRF